MSKSKKTKEDIMQALDKQIEIKKTLPKNVEEDINNNIFRNIIIAIVIMLYFYFINLGYLNIKEEAYLIDLKTFTIGLIVTSIVIFEIAYKKDSGKIAIHGIEILLLAIATLFSIHLYVGIPNKYVYIYTLISYIFTIYYIIKSVIIYKKKKKHYKLLSAKEITQKDNKIQQELNKQVIKKQVNKAEPEQKEKKNKKQKEEKANKPKDKHKTDKEEKEEKKKTKKGKRMKERGEK